VIEVPLTTLTFVAALPPKLTVAPAKNPVPVIVTEVLPAVVPVSGDTEEMVGGGAGSPPLLARIVVSFLVGPGALLR
jgi:hypothetical protein